MAGAAPGSFDPEFLDVPREVIVLTMRTNQKYFACTNDQGLLAPAFVCVANIDANDGGKAIAEGNAGSSPRACRDARFFWEQDVKVPLEKQAQKLSGIVFHEKLGTVADKVERVAKLARWLVQEGIVKGAEADQVERAARLAKADLVTGMVGEFPELQGVIGGYLAEAQGEPSAVADAIRDQYGTPTEPAAVAVALADKLDSICAFFSIDQKPTGSKDPFALRRSAHWLNRTDRQEWAALGSDQGRSWCAGQPGGFRCGFSAGASARQDCARSAPFLRRSAKGPATRRRRSARFDRCGVFPWWRRRPRPAARARERASAIRGNAAKAPTCSPPTSAPPTS